MMSTQHPGDAGDSNQADDAGPAQAARQPCSTGTPQTAGPTRRRRILPVLFFALLLAHVAGNIEPRILYQADEALLPGRQVPVFPYYFQGMAFFKQFLATPGGLTEYIGANLSQYFSLQYARISVGGTAILAVIALMAFLATGDLVGLMGGRKRGMLRFIPPLLLVVIWNRYTFVLADQIALLAALVSACLYLRLPDKPILRGMVFVPAAAALYYVAGGACMLLAAMCGLHEFLARRRRAAGGVYLAIGGLAPLVIGLLAFGLTVRQAYWRLLGPHAGGGALAAAGWAALYGFFIALTVVMAFRHRLKAPAELIVGRFWEKMGRYGRGRARAVGPAAAMLVLAALAATATLDRHVRTFRRMCYCSQMRIWSGVILQAREYPRERYTLYTCRMVNRALFEQGLLGAEMFAYPQTPTSGLVPRVEMDQPYKSDTLLRLGAVNRIEHLALESLEQWGPRPFLLQLLARIYIIKEDMPTARVFLNKLSGDIAHGENAREQLRELNNEENIASDDEIMEIRSYMLAEGDLDPLSPEEMLEALVARNERNHMAFEYLLAHYLLTGQLGDFVARVGGLRDFDYDAIPLHYGEAVILHYSRTGQWPDLDELPMSSATLERGDRFMALVRLHGDGTEALVHALAREMANSYFYYYYVDLRAGRSR